MAIEIKPLVVEITEAAVEQINTTLQSQSTSDLFLRIYVQGGCGGISFGMALDNRGLDGDISVEQSGIKVVVDKNSVSYVNGASIDFDTTGDKSGYKISNPNVDMNAGSCGSGSCGSGSDSGSCGSGSCGDGGCC